MRKPAQWKKSTCGTCGSVVNTLNYRWCRWAREKAGVGLRELSRRLSVSPSYIHDIEVGRRGITKKIVEAYCKLGEK